MKSILNPVSGLLFKSPAGSQESARELGRARSAESMLSAAWEASGKVSTYGLIRIPAVDSKPALQILVNNNRYKASFSSFLSSLERKKPTLLHALKYLQLADATFPENSSSRSFACGDVVPLERVFASAQYDRSIPLSVFLHSLLETYSDMDTRAVLCVEPERTRGMILIRNSRKELSLLDPLTGQTVTDPGSDARIIGLEAKVPALPCEKTKQYSIFNGKGNEVTFRGSGRTPSEKRFSAEAKRMEEAGPEDLLPYEIFFHPFWRRYGHTTVRIGEELYEFSSDGWKGHNTGLDSARAYLFNNPFFKSRYSVFSPTGMPPVSFGCTRLAPKEKVVRMLEILRANCAKTGKDREKFSLFFNNCNHQLRAVFRQAGLEGFEERGYMDFSSVLTFNSLVNGEEESEFRFYPLPGIVVSEESFRGWVPGVISLSNSPGKERTRAVKSVFVDVGVGLAVAANWVSTRLFGRKVWKGFDNYQHVNDRWPAPPEISPPLDLRKRVEVFLARNPGSTALVREVCFKKKEQSSKSTAQRDVLVISTRGLRGKRKTALLADYKRLMEGNSLSFPLWERSTHLLLQTGGRIFDYGFWVIPFWPGRHIATKLYRFRERKLRMPGTRRLEPVVALSSGEKERTDRYLELLDGGFKKILGDYYDPGCQFTNGTLEDNRARVGHNCTSWITTAPIGEKGECLLELLGTTRSHEIGTNPGWWSHWLLYACTPDRLPLVIYWSQDPLKEILESQVIRGGTIRWDFNRK